VEVLAIGIVKEPAVITALEGEEGHHGQVGDGTVGEVIYRGNESENGKRPTTQTTTVRLNA
jgi:hypothetical protein